MDDPVRAETEELAATARIVAAMDAIDDLLRRRIHVSDLTNVLLDLRLVLSGARWQR